MGSHVAETKQDKTDTELGGSYTVCGKTTEVRRANFTNAY